MSDHKAAYEILAADLERQGLDVNAIKEAIKNHHIETPSWGYANSGTRFKAFPWPGAATTTNRLSARGSASVGGAIAPSAPGM